MSSPPTRGCSGLQGPRRGEDEVLPADAGVFRTPTAASAPSSGPPRRRGGVPRVDLSYAVETVSSPPTQGCSVPLLALGHRPVVLPADAGVFRSPHGRRSAWTCPPRRRGGVPEPSSRFFFRGPSSPPTRGCSAGQGGDELHAGVLPADAGVFRRPCRRCGPRSGPPRRRGGVPSSGEKYDSSSPPPMHSSRRCWAMTPPADGIRLLAVGCRLTDRTLPSHTPLRRLSARTFSAELGAEASGPLPVRGASRASAELAGSVRMLWKNQAAEEDGTVEGKRPVRFWGCRTMGDLTGGSAVGSCAGACAAGQDAQPRDLPDRPVGRCTGRCSAQKPALWGGTGCAGPAWGSCWAGLRRLLGHSCGQLLCALGAVLGCFLRRGLDCRAAAAWLLQGGSWL